MSVPVSLSPMPLQNRVDPRGRLIADPARGSWTGNRVHAGRLWAWQPYGYSLAGRVDHAEAVTVLTPRLTVNAIAAGYEAQVALP